MSVTDLYTPLLPLPSSAGRVRTKSAAAFDGGQLAINNSIKQNNNNNYILLVEMRPRG